MSLIIVPFDFSRTATKALDQALLLASMTRDVVEVVHVTNDTVAKTYPKFWKCDKRSVNKFTQILNDKVLDRLNKNQLTNVMFDVRVKESVMIAPSIVNHCLLTRAGLVVMGTHGHTAVADKIFGSNTSAIVNQALFPVLAVPVNWKPILPKTLVTAVDLNELANLSRYINYWSSELHCEIEVLNFSLTPEFDKANALKTITHIPKDSFRILKQDLLLTLAQQVKRYMQRRKDCFLAMFVHERKLFEKIFDSSTTEKVSGVITVPLLAIPTTDVLAFKPKQQSSNKNKSKVELDMPYEALVR